MLKLILATFAAMVATVPAAASERPAYAEGQVWEYKARPQDKGSLVKIQKIETLPELGERGPVYHVSIRGVRFDGPQPVVGLIGHLPVSRETLAASLTRLADDQGAAFPSVEDGIAEWRAAKGGVFTITLSEIVDIAERAIPEAAPPS